MGGWSEAVRGRVRGEIWEGGKKIAREKSKVKMGGEGEGEKEGKGVEG